MSRKRRTNAEGLLYCSRENHYLPRSEFYDRSRKLKSGEPCASAWCKDCYRKYALDYSIRKKGKA